MSGEYAHPVRLRQLVAVLLALLVTAGLGAGCRGDAPPAAPPRPATPPPAEPWQGSLAPWVAADATAWAYVDLDALRALEPLGDLLAAGDGIGGAMFGARDVLVVWPALPDNRLHVIRTDVPLAPIEASLSTAESPAGRPMQPGSVADRRIWRDAPTSQAVSVAAPNLLVTGSFDAVEAAVWRSRNGAGSSLVPFTHDIEATLAPGPLQRAALARAVPRPELGDLVRRIRQLQLRADVADGLALELRAELEPGAPSGTVRALVAVLLVELLEQVLVIDDAAARVASDVIAEADGTETVRWSARLDPSDVVVLAALIDPDLAAALSAQAAPDPGARP